MTVRAFLLSAALASAPFAATAADWTLDKSHTTVSFEVNHLGFSQTRGVFREFDAEISYDPEAIEASTVSFTIDAASIDTFWEARDNHVRGEDFLDVANHPEITFVSTGVTAIDEDSATLTGDLTIKGVTQPVTFAAELNAAGPNPFDATKQVAGFQLTGEIDRTAFGINYGAPAIGAVIPVVIDLEIGAEASDT
ncbi:MAG: YceI family protein [Pseudomonadota bacterium]